MLKINIFSQENREYLSERHTTLAYLIYWLRGDKLYTVKIFIEDKEVKKIDDQQRKTMLEKALSTFHKKDVKVICTK